MGYGLGYGLNSYAQVGYGLGYGIGFDHVTDFWSDRDSNFSLDIDGLQSMMLSCNEHHNFHIISIELRDWCVRL